MEDSFGERTHDYGGCDAALPAEWSSRWRRGNHHVDADARKLDSFEPSSTMTVEYAAWVWPQETARCREHQGPCRLQAG